MSGEKPPEWLPDGWMMEVRKTRTGSKYRCYFDPSTGSKFYSGKEAQRHLKDGNLCSTKSSQKRSQNTNLDNVIAQFEHSPDGLPRGWIKETKFRKSAKQRNGTRKDPYYTEPVTGYVFRSLKDCFRYINTGKISKHAFLPKNKEKSNTSSSDMKSSAPNSDEEMAGVVEELPEGSKSPSPQNRSAQCQNASDSAFTTQSTVEQEMKTRTGSEEVVQSVTGEWSESVNPPNDEQLMLSHGARPEPSVHEQLELLSITPNSAVKSSKRPRRKSEVEQLLETQTNIEDLNKFGRGNNRLSVTERKSLKVKLEPSADKSSLLEDTHSLSVNQESSKGATKHGSSGAKAQKSITGPRRASMRLAMLNSVQKPDLQTPDIPQQIIHSPSKKAKQVTPQTDPVLVKPDAEAAEQPADTADMFNLDNILATPFRGPLEDIMACPCIEFAVRTLTNDLPEFDGSLDDYVQSQLVSPPSSHPASSVSTATDAQHGLRPINAVVTKQDEKPCSADKITKKVARRPG